MNKSFKILAWSSNIILWILCLAPIELSLPAPISRVDLFYHALAYELVATCFFMAYPSKKIFICLGLIFQGILIEYIQPYTGRYFEIYDMIANSTGVIFALILWIAFVEKLKLALFEKFNLPR